MDPKLEGLTLEQAVRQNIGFVGVRVNPYNVTKYSPFGLSRNPNPKFRERGLAALAVPLRKLIDLCMAGDLVVTGLVGPEMNEKVIAPHLWRAGRIDPAEEKAIIGPDEYYGLRFWPPELAPAEPAPVVKGRPSKYDGLVDKIVKALEMGWRGSFPQAIENAGGGCHKGGDNFESAVRRRYRELHGPWPR